MNETVAGKEDKFEKGYFWELYIDLERQFRAFLTYVPYLKGNEKTYSYRLLSMILSIGGTSTRHSKKWRAIRNFLKILIAN